MRKLNTWQAWIGMAAIVVPFISAMAWGTYSHFAKASEVIELVERLDSVDERMLKQRAEALDTLILQREERSLPPRPQWIKEREKKLEQDRCLYRQRFDRRVRCDK